MSVGLPELALLAVMAAPLILLLWILLNVLTGASRRRNAQLDRVERRLDDLDRRVGPDLP